MIRHRTRGFTLIELLAGIAIFALISATLYGAFGIAVRAFDSAVRRTDSEQRMRVVSRFLQQSLEQGYPLALANRDGWRLHFEGDARSLRYVANLPGFLGFGGLYEVIFRTHHENGRQRLLLERRPLFIDRARGELRGALDRQVLMEELQSIRLRYFGSSEGDDKPRWWDEWRDAKRLPALVEVRITDAAGTAWPSVVARPRVNHIRFQMATGLTSGSSGSFPSTGSVDPTTVLN